MDNLGTCVHACIGAAGNGHVHRFIGNLRQRLLHTALYGSIALLQLPSAKPGSVVFDNCGNTHESILNRAKAGHTTKGKLECRPRCVAGEISEVFLRCVRPTSAVRVLDFPGPPAGAHGEFRRQSPMPCSLLHLLSYGAPDRYACANYRADPRRPTVWTSY